MLSLNDAFIARTGLAIQSRNENPWLNGLGLNEVDLNNMRGIQATYLVQLDDQPHDGYMHHIWLLWDYNRLWGIFEFGLSKGMFLVDPGFNLWLCDEDGSQELPFTWRGFRKADPNVVFCDESITTGRIRIGLRGKIEGVFEFMHGNGSADGNFEGEQCSFHGKRQIGPRVVPYTLREAVQRWNSYVSGFPGMEEKVRQYLSPANTAADPLEDVGLAKERATHV